MRVRVRCERSLQFALGVYVDLPGPLGAFGDPSGSWPIAVCVVAGLAAYGTWRWANRRSTRPFAVVLLGLGIATVLVLASASYARCPDPGLSTGWSVVTRVVGLVTNRPEDAGTVVGALIDHPAVRRISFTGSTAVGRIVARRAAEQLKPVLLELGGKAPLLVLDDADLDQAVAAAAFGAFLNQGQICMSTERVIVVDSVADDFVARFKAKAETLKSGDPVAGTTPLGAMIDRKAVDWVGSLIDDAVAAGATRLGGSAPGTGVLMDATVLDGVTDAMKIYAHESFGPVVAVIRAKDEAEAIALANDTEYGLSASVFTRDTARGLRVARQIKSGICHVNGPTVHDEAQMPFGGVKASGYGRFGGKAGIDSFTELRWVTIETQPGHFPI